MVRKKNTWGLAEAKAELSEVVQRAQHTPQLIERRGKAVGVVIGIQLHEEAERSAALGSADQRMERFLQFSSTVRAQGGAELAIPARLPRKSPIGK
jgi:prevent-host-death family protein